MPWVLLVLSLVGLYIYQPVIPHDKLPSWLAEYIPADKITYERPPAGKGANPLYTIAQIRWCLREDITLTELNRKLEDDPSQGDMRSYYNSRIETYNQRCTAFRYRQRDMQRAQKHIALERESILAALPRPTPASSQPAHSPLPHTTAATTTAVAATSGTRLSTNGHGMRDDNAHALCGRTQSKKIGRRRAQSVYRRVDEDGVVQFTQRGGGQAEYIGDQYKTQQRLFDLTITFNNNRYDPVIHDAFHQNAYRVYDRLKELIDRPYWRRVSLNILLYEDKAAWNAKRQQAGLSEQTGAFFSGSENRIHMPYTQENRERMLEIARHEISHALLAGMVGPTPTWLNEGLAEYMERGAYYTVQSTLNPDRLHRLLAMTSQQFYNDGAIHNYQNAYTLIKYLMSQTQGKQVISHFLNELAANPCAKLDSPAIMSRAHPGGLTQLARGMRL